MLRPRLVAGSGAAITAAVGALAIGCSTSASLGEAGADAGKAAQSASVDSSQLVPPGWPRPFVSGMTPDDSWAALGHRIFRRTGAAWSPVDGWQSLPEVQALPQSWPIGPIRAGASGELWAMVGPGVLLHWSAGSWQAL